MTRQWAVAHPERNKTCPMLRKVSLWQHLLVGVSIVVMALLAGFGVIGAGDESLIRPEHFDAKQVTVWSDGGDGVWVREVVDIDFGVTARHGYQRIIPNDFGIPADVTAESPDANAQLDMVQIGGDTRIRIGDPGVTFIGRHRYVLEYRLPDADVTSARLDLDIIGNDETFETQRFEVVLTGFEFDPIVCLTGAREALGGCEFERGEFERGEFDNLVAVIEPLGPGDGITVSGAIVSLTTPTMPTIPDPPGAIWSGFRPLGLVMIPLGLAAATLVFLVGRAAGSNTVLAGGAAEAALGELPAPGDRTRRRDVATYRVPDSRLAELATIEFAPPRGLEPWQAAVVLRETVDNDSVSAWFSEMIADAAIVATDDDGTVSLSRGPDTSRLSAVDLGHLQRLFGQDDVVELGKYDKEFTATWNAIRAEQLGFASNAGWWSRGGPGGRATTPLKVIGVSVALLGVAAGLVALVGLATTEVFWLVLASPWLAVIAGLLVPLVVAAIAYRPMFASRTATGSALALRTESFRRFLAASEGRHVDWAWAHGLVREYSAWAVALGAADAWSKAVEASNIPDPQIALSGPLIVHSAGSAFASSHTPPSSSRAAVEALAAAEAAGVRAPGERSVVDRREQRRDQLVNAGAVGVDDADRVVDQLRIGRHLRPQRQARVDRRGECRHRLRELLPVDVRRGEVLLLRADGHVVEAAAFDRPPLQGIGRWCRHQLQRELVGDPL